MKPIFLLGVGAQKAGTTWLSHYLRHHPQCAMGPIKEIAVHEIKHGDAETVVRRQANMKRLATAATQAAEDLKERRPIQDIAELSAMLEQVHLEVHPKHYMDFFDRNLQRKPGAYVVGDITPSYSTFSGASFKEIRAMIEEAGYTPKAFFLMRDPVERCFSAQRMSDRNASTQSGKLVSRAHEHFVKKAFMPSSVKRTRYDYTVAALREAFEPEELFFDIYERFITTEGVKSFTNWVGIDFVNPNLEHRSNLSPRSKEPAGDDIKEVRAFFDPVYEFAFELFGEQAVRELWKWA